VIFDSTATYICRIARMNEKSEQTAALALERAEWECRRETIAYREWLSFLRPLGWFCLAGGVIFSGAAGVSILWSTFQGGKIVSALLAFTASALTGLHGVLKCDSHQTECRKMIQSLKSLSTEIALCKTLNPAEQTERRDRLVTQLIRLIKKVDASPAPWCYRRADRQNHDDRFSTPAL
jgi:hypothetical protein